MKTTGNPTMAHHLERMVAWKTHLINGTDYCALWRTAEGWLLKGTVVGEHDQTAFALGLMLDYARASGDKDCPLAHEPSGEDFLSPCLGEADLMRRVLPGPEFARWLETFRPQISPARKGAWLEPVVSPDPSDPKLAHLDGLNLSAHGC